jgi:hypothetical protein
MGMIVIVASLLVFACDGKPPAKRYSGDITPTF